MTTFLVVEGCSEIMQFCFSSAHFDPFTLIHSTIYESAHINAETIEFSFFFISFAEDLKSENSISQMK
jgi:hypothetical protein